MVSVDNITDCGKKEMAWLTNRGRTRVERMARRFNSEILKGGGDFYVTIDLPTDVLVVITPIGSVCSSIYRFDKYRRKAAVKLYRLLKDHPEVSEAKLVRAKRYLGLSDTQYQIDVGWHGNEAYWRGWDYVSTIIPETLFKKGL
jgi:hypothetical protein